MQTYLTGLTGSKHRNLRVQGVTLTKHQTRQIKMAFVLPSLVQYPEAGNARQNAVTGNVERQPGLCCKATSR